MNPFRYAAHPGELSADAVLTPSGLQFRLAFERHLALLGRKVWPDGTEVRLATSAERPLIGLRAATKTERGVPVVRCNAGVGAPHLNRCRIGRIVEQQLGTRSDEWSLVECDAGGFEVVLAPRASAVSRLTALVRDTPEIALSHGFRTVAKDKHVFVGERTSILSNGGTLTAVRRDAVLSELRLCAPFMTSERLAEWIRSLQDKE